MTDRKKTRPTDSGTDGRLSPGFHLMAKPSGPCCNLRCTYCFYSEKTGFFPAGKPCRMADEILEAYTREYIASQPGPSVVFDWQGGEPTTLGIDFFQQALDLQKQYSRGKQISNTLQTNGTLLDETWCEFLARNHFLVGLSMDGPEAVHDAYRVDGDGNPTFARVLHALRMMQKHGVEVNILATVNSESSKRPLDVYRFFKQHGVRFIQFIPIIERAPDVVADSLGLALAGPPAFPDAEKVTEVTPWSVMPKDYGEFLIEIFKEWVNNDVGKTFIMNFEWTLASWAGLGPGVCYLAPRCGDNLILEHNGDVYSCDHFMYPAYRLGNILKEGLVKMARSNEQIAFGERKETALPECCRKCDVLFACRGGCPKHRFANSPDGLPGLNYLCEGFKNFFHYVNPYMKHMVGLINRGMPVQKIMETAELYAISGKAPR